MDGALQTLVSKKLATDVAASEQGDFDKEIRLHETDYIPFYELDQKGEPQRFWIGELGPLASRSAQKAVLSHVVRRCKRLFPGNPVFLSEKSPVIAFPIAGLE
jgi:hypothetical protein